MFDSQKLAFENFLLGYKHGVYVFTKDGCHACEDYKNEIKWINNCFLYFVEVVKDEERAILTKLIDRKAFPLTVGYIDNEIKFIEQGVIYEKGWVKIHQFLEKFPKNPLPPDEIQRRIEKQKNRCLLTYYAIPQNIQGVERTRILNKGIEYNEFPIDIDAVCPDLPSAERERMLEGCYHFAKMVLWKGGTYSNFTNDIILGYTINNQDIKFIQRDIEVNNDTNNSN